MRVRSPSTTLTLTETVSPGSNGGMFLASLVICSCSSCLIRFMEVSVGCAGNAGRNSAYQVRLMRLRVGEAHTIKNALCHPFAPARPNPSAGRRLGPFSLRFKAARHIGGPQVGPALAGQALGLALVPGLDLGVVAAGQHLGNGAAFPDGGAGELRIFEQAAGVALLGPRGFLAHDARQQPDAGVDERIGRDLA